MSEQKVDEMFPVGIVGKNNYRAYTAFFLIAINVVVFIWEILLQVQGTDVLLAAFREFAFNVCAIGTESAVLISRNAVISMFLHGSFLHLFGNMLFLWLFAPKVEAYFGSRRFIAFYLLTGLAASAAHTLFGGVQCSVNQPYAGLAIGASGAISGVMGAFLFLHPGAKVASYILIFRIPLAKIKIPAFIFLGLYFLMDLINGLDTSTATNVAHWAHIGGFVAGFAIVFIATFFKPAPKVDPFEHLDE